MKCYISIKEYFEYDDTVLEYLKVFKSKEKAINFTNIQKENKDIISKKHLDDVIKSYIELYTDTEYENRKGKLGNIVEVHFPGIVIPSFDTSGDDFKNLFNLLYKKYRHVLVKNKIDLSEEDYKLLEPYIEKGIYEHGFDSLNYWLTETELDLTD